MFIGNFLQRLRLSLLLGVMSVFNVQADDKPVELMGYLNFSMTWTQDIVPHFGFYSFSNDGSTTLTGLGNTVGEWENVSNGGAYANGKYYCMLVTGNYASYKSYFRVYDVATWTLEKDICLGTNNEESVTGDMTYDHVSGVLYASTRPFGNTETGHLVTIDRETGAITRIAETGFMCALAADAKGQLWGIDRNGVLYKIGKDGNKERIGATGFVPNTTYSQSATIDYRTGRMYWIFSGHVEGDIYKSTFSRLFDVDLATGAATTLTTFSNEEKICALGIVNAHPDAPDDIADLSFSPTAPGSMTGKVTFTVPTLSYAQSALSGDVDITLTLDGEPAESGKAAPGSTFTRDITVSGEGNHTASVVLSHGGHDGVKASRTTYFGIDAPSPVTDLTFVTDESRSTATLTWTAPTAGLNGGYIDTDAITYDITRLPEQSVAATGYKGNSFSEIIPDNMQNMRYKVEVSYNGQKSKAAYSNYAIGGQPWSLPFIEMFNDAASFNKFTVIDANNDSEEYEEFYAPRWHYDSEYAAAFYYTNSYIGQADDWLITPAMSLEKGNGYRVTFKAYGYHGYPNQLQLTVGRKPTVESQSRIISDHNFSAPNLSPVQLSADFVAEDGDCYIGFHNISDGSDHMSIDDIFIRKLNSGDVPAVVTEATASANQDKMVELAFTLPTTTANGKALEGTLDVYIYKGIETKPVATIRGCQPGSRHQWTDEHTIPAVNTYYITATNDKGESIRTTVEINMAEGIPGAVSDIEVSLNTNGHVELNWSAPAAGTDSEGRPIVPENVQYTITRISGAVFTELARDYRGTSFTDTDPLADTDGQQGIVLYRITPTSATGEGPQSTSPVITVGEAYTLPFEETWMNQIATTGPWRSDAQNLSWSVVSTGYDPFALGQDGPGLLKAEGDDIYMQPGSGYYISPRINFSEVVEPKLTFYMYGATSYDGNTYLQVGYETADGKRTLLPETFYAKADANGWRQFEADLSALEGVGSASFFFYANINTPANNCIHIDNVRVTGSKPENEIKMETLSGPVTLMPGTDGEYRAVVANVGNSKIENITVSLFAGTTLVDSKSIDNINAGEREELDFIFTPSSEHANSTITLRAVVQAEADGIDVNNERTLDVSVGEVIKPYVSTIKGYSDYNHAAIISWNTPDCSSVKKQITDGAEDYEAFAIDGIGHWTMYDGDKTMPCQLNYGEDILEYTNSSELQAFIVFNPAKTTPAVSLDAHSGEQYFACWSADKKTNDDWMISPLLSGDQQMISFYARCVTSDYDEPFDVLFSRGGTDVTEFIKLNQEGTLTPSGTDWTLFRYTLPEGARHFAINYTGNNKMGLLIDDVLYEGFDTSRKPDGYNVYRDGQRINNELVTEQTYTDGGRTAGAVHAYHITAVYGNEESEPSADVIITINDPAGIDAATAATQAVRIGTKPGHIIVEGAEGKNIAVYTADGRLVSRITGTGTSVLPVNAGLYIVKTDGATAKVVVR